ncbi:metal-dependent hydrolase [Methylophaga marina]|uniref:SprT family zinc-dependent metalloprotease n=1 Tax=Methylophaga marina TaxID=45495 RepID=A0ABP3DKP7_9GAMM|nr:SprT family zinc-dependent metalloprotease [Methylophaga marina]BDZ74888.1 metal-dependent hydrolase [Methylophaga marina]
MPEVTIGSLDVELNRKDIKNLHISVLPPDGRVRVSAPLKLTETAIRTAVVHRLPWIKRQQHNFANQLRESAREFVSGETHYLWGKRYRLEVIERFGKHEIKLSGNRLRMYVRNGTTLEKRTELLNSYYRQEVKLKLPMLLELWGQNLGVRPSSYLVRKMRTKWGSCNQNQKRILINSELAKKPSDCLEFVVLHEIAHLLERHHNDRFVALLDKNMPQWPEVKALLNKLPVHFD